jgi:hypothetical protein
VRSPVLLRQSLTQATAFSSVYGSLQAMVNAVTKHAREHHGRVKSQMAGGMSRP